MKQAEDYAKELMGTSFLEMMTPKPLNEHSLDDCKMKINNILHTYLPAETNLAETEILALVMFEIVTNPKRFLIQPEKK